MTYIVLVLYIVSVSVYEITRLMRRSHDTLAFYHCDAVYGHQLPQRSGLMETIVKGGRDQRQTMCTSYREWCRRRRPCSARWGLSFGFNQWACSMPRPCADSHLFIGNLITWAILNSVGEGMRVMSPLPWVTVRAWEAGQGGNSHKWLLRASFIYSGENVHLLWV